LRPHGRLCTASKKGVRFSSTQRATNELILGLITGARIYAEAYPALTSTVLKWGDLGEVMLPSIPGASPWAVIPILIAVCLGFFMLFEKKGL
jgi:hypothetical protein